MNTNSAAAVQSLPMSLVEFQHGVLRDWIFDPTGAFLNDLLAGNEINLRAFLRDRLSLTDFKITRPASLQGILLHFPEPQNDTECSFIFISTKGENPRIFTCEASARPTRPMACELLPGRSRMNYGALRDIDLQTFLDRVEKVLEEKNEHCFRS